MDDTFDDDFFDDDIDDVFNNDNINDDFFFSRCRRYNDDIYDVF